VQALRPATAAASTSRAAIARAPLGITGLAARAYATDLKKHTDTLRPPAPEKPTETYIKRFRGKGFPNVPVSDAERDLSKLACARCARPQTLI
jgi:hypothetical protein